MQESHFLKRRTKVEREIIHLISIDGLFAVVSRKAGRDRRITIRQWSAYGACYESGRSADPDILFKFETLRIVRQFGGLRHAYLVKLFNGHVSPVFIDVDLTVPPFDGTLATHCGSRRINELFGAEEAVRGEQPLRNGFDSKCEGEPFHSVKRLASPPVGSGQPTIGTSPRIHALQVTLVAVGLAKQILVENGRAAHVFGTRVRPRDNEVGFVRYARQYVFHPALFISGVRSTNDDRVGLVYTSHYPCPACEFHGVRAVAVAPRRVFGNVWQAHLPGVKWMK